MFNTAVSKSVTLLDFVSQELASMKMEHCEDESSSEGVTSLTLQLVREVSNCRKGLLDQIRLLEQRINLSDG